MEDRIAIITGAGSGIGKASAIRLAKKGIRVILTSRSMEKLLEVEKIINVNAGRKEKLCHVVCGDISNQKVIELCITECSNIWHKLPDILLASAGRGLPGTLSSSNTNEWDELIDTNLKGLMYQLRSVTDVMIRKINNNPDYVNSPLDIIVIGSTIGRNVSPFNPIYGATKFAAHGLTEGLRRELGPKGIRVTLVEPGLVSTNFQKSAGYNAAWFEEYSKEIGPVLEGEDIAKVIEFILSLPGNVHLDNVSIRPTRQAYP